MKLEKRKDLNTKRRKRIHAKEKEIKNVFVSIFL